MEKCCICNKEFKNINGLVQHIHTIHNIESKEYYDKYLKHLNDGICSICGKKTNFKSLSKGYNKYCSDKCRGVALNRNLIDEEKERRKEKLRQTCLERYGVDNPSKIKGVGNKISNSLKNKSTAEKEKIVEKRKNTKLERYGNAHYNNPEKNKQTCLERYGVEVQWQREEIKEKCNTDSAVEKAKETRKTTNINRFGVDTPLRLESTIEKSHSKEAIEKQNEARIKSNLETYGVENVFQLDSVKEKIKETHDNYVISIEEKYNCTQIHKLYKQYGYINIRDNYRIVKDKNIFYVGNEHLLDIKKDSKLKKCGGTSIYENEILDFIKEYYDGNIEHKTRKVISPLELDIYIPDKQVAIEFNGIYWHSTNVIADKKYHLNKTIACENLGIRLIHIFEDEWIFNKEICKSIILYSLGIYTEKLNAKDCIVKKVKPDEEKDFLNENHIQGYIPSNSCYGLYNKNTLVELISFRYPRFKNGEIELLRSCTKLNTMVIGGFGKLLKHQPHKEFITYVDRSKFTGNNYIMNNFILDKINPPGYFYYKNGNRINRLSTQKYKLKSLLGKENFNPNETETENMNRNGYLKLYDSGTLKFKYSIRG